MFVIMFKFIAFFALPVSGNYECLCNYGPTIEVYEDRRYLDYSLGRLYEFECKPTVAGEVELGGIVAIQYGQQKGYIKMAGNDAVIIRQCHGSPSPTDVLLSSTTATTIAALTTETSGPTSDLTNALANATTTNNILLSSESLTTTLDSVFSSLGSIDTSVTAPTTTTLSLSSTTRTAFVTHILTGHIPQGHTELCPSHIQTDINLFGGFIGQYGDYCYELVNRSTQWDNAEHHCRLISQGHLVNIPDQNTQDYLVSFLASHRYVDNVWIGLSDKANETVYTWTSGNPVSFTNFEYRTGSVNYSLTDCVVMKKDGKWRDTGCGVALVFGTGFGESHPYICQYNVTSKPTDIFHVPTDVILG